MLVQIYTEMIDFSSLIWVSWISLKTQGRQIGLGDGVAPIRRLPNSNLALIQSKVGAKIRRQRRRLRKFWKNFQKAYEWIIYFSSILEKFSRPVGAFYI